MKRQVVTAAEVTGASAGRLVVAPDAIVTPLARDVARERGVEIVRGGRPAPVPPGPGGDGCDGDLAARVRAIVTAMLGSGEGGFAAPTGGLPGHR